MRRDVVDALEMMYHECERTDLPVGLKCILVKVLALVPQAYLAGWQDREAVEVMADGGTT